jgi:hypothetical protein
VRCPHFSYNPTEYIPLIVIYTVKSVQNQSRIKRIPVLEGTVSGPANIARTNVNNCKSNWKKKDYLYCGLLGDPENGGNIFL